MTASPRIGWLIALAGLTPGLPVCAATPADRLRAASLDAAEAGVSDPLKLALANVRHPDGITLDLVLADDDGEPIADCLAGQSKPGDVSSAD